MLAKVIVKFSLFETEKKKKKLADIFTKPLPRERFYLLRNELKILDFQNLS